MTSNPKTSRYICIHGHFYQPSRENPWLEAVEREETAAPYHDWNERILTECYAPNSRSRIQNEKGQIIRISNNYQKISFNFGPTLLSWMEEKAGITLKVIQQADHQSLKDQDGHGNALAQAYNHIILPLAEERDVLTQIRWGKADFRKRFNRDPEGMWLPETAVDLRTLEVLVREGIKFTILAPHQAKCFRPLGQQQWTEAQGIINSRRPYWCNLPGGQKIAIFFYDGGLAHGIAFENYLQNGEILFQRLLNGFDPQDSGPQLVNVATDGESYGHHRLFGDMALAYALHQLDKDPAIQLKNYGWFLAHFPPQFEVEIYENTSWSCAHGIERWRANCGCRLDGPELQQAWRAPLREGLNRLKNELDLLFESRAASLLKDPWQARDAYIQVLLDRSPENLERFFVEQGSKPSRSLEDRIQTLKLMEMQRCGLLMFTSCAWFFDEISGLETTQILKYACRAIQIAKDFGSDLEESLLTDLKKAPSNKKEFGDGAKIWQQKVRPFTVDLSRVLAHYAIGSIYQKNQKDRIYCYRLSHQDQVILPQNGSHLAVGRLKVSSTITLEEQEGIFAVFHFGGVDFQCLLKPYPNNEGYETFKKDILNLYKTTSLGDVYDWVKEIFDPGRFYLKDLFSEERQRLINLLLQERMENHILLLEEWVKEDIGTLIKLIEMGVSLPNPMKMALTLILDRALEKGLQEAFPPWQQLEGLQEFFNRSQELGYPLPNEQVQQRIQIRIEKEIKQLKAYLDPDRLFTAIYKMIQICHQFDVPLNLWNVQNSFLDACRDLPQNKPEYREHYRAFALKIDLPPEVIGWEAE
jgi:alpha-amylase/alpha-mannosidase (GH57 family)